MNPEEFNEAKAKGSSRVVSHVLRALRASENPRGPTSSEVINHVQEAGVDKPRLSKRQIETALKRSVEFGTVECKRGRYKVLSMGPTIDEAKASEPSCSRKFTNDETTKFEGKTKKAQAPRGKKRGRPAKNASEGPKNNKKSKIEEGDGNDDDEDEDNDNDANDIEDGDDNKSPRNDENAGKGDSQETQQLSDASSQASEADDGDSQQ